MYTYIHIGVYVFIYIYIVIYVHVHTHRCICIYVYIYRYIMWTYKHIGVYVSCVRTIVAQNCCRYIGICVRVYTHRCVYVYIHTYMYVYTNMPKCIYVYIHILCTHIHMSSVSTHLLHIHINVYVACQHNSYKLLFLHTHTNNCSTGIYIHMWTYIQIGVYVFSVNKIHRNYMTHQPRSPHTHPTLTKNIVPFAYIQTLVPSTPTQITVPQELYDAPASSAHTHTTHSHKILFCSHIYKLLFRPLTHKWLFHRNYTMYQRLQQKITNF